MITIKKKKSSQIFQKNVLKACSPRPPDLHSKKKIHRPSQRSSSPVEPQPIASQKHPGRVWNYDTAAPSHRLLHD
jgi:hypothetical protein